MVFNSIFFIFCFLPVFMLIYYLVPGKLRNLILFLGSLVFYAWGEPIYVILMLFSSIFNYYMGAELERLYYDEKRQKLNLVFAVIVNLGILVFFKYYGFLLNTIGGITGLHIPHPELSLPIGLSFYTFRNLSYLFDVYLSKISAQHNFLTFATYSTMFPYTSAGPIVRYTDIQKQLNRRSINITRFGMGAELFIKGLAKKVILATGGLSYPATGSTGDGYRLAQSAGHTIVPPTPSLVPLEEAGDTCAQMQGLSLKNVTLTLKNQKKKVVFQEQGEMLFTHFGLSGPLVLSASAHANWSRDTYTAVLDLKPALEEEKLEARILRDIAQAPNKAFHNFLEGLLPRRMVPVMGARVDIAPDLPVNALTKAQRRRLVEAMKHFALPLAGPRPIREAIVTAGGVKTGEVDPGTMMSKKTAGLFFAGEILDLDAYTGGFNLQIAWCTGRAAGEGAARYSKEERE